MRRLPGSPAVLVALTATMMTAATAVSLTAAAAPAAAPAAGQPMGAAARIVLLITGERFAVGPPSVLTRLPGGRRHGMVALSLSGGQYEIPDSALPYLGRGLDPNLFSLSALRDREADGRIPVVIRFSGRRPVLPGVRITGAAAGTATGYLTASSARAFGAALARQLIADHARASYGNDGMFGDGTSVSLAGGSAGAARVRHRPGPVTRPSFGLHTLTIKATDLSGKPDAGDLVIVINADNPARFSDLGAAIEFFDHGIAKFSEPAGHYFAIGFFTPFKRGAVVATRITVLPRFSVSRDRTVRTSERAASSEITMVTARRAISVDDVFELIQTPAVGQRLNFSFDAAGLPMWISPTHQRPAVGKLATVTSAVLTSPRAHRPNGPGYMYELSYQNLSGLIPRQFFTIKQNSLAALSTRFYSSKPLPEGFGFQGVYPIESGDLLLVDLLGLGGGFAVEAHSQAPLLYLTANPSLTWFFSLARSQSLGDGTGFFAQQTDSRSFRPGHYIQAWNQYPLHPAPSVDLPGMVGQSPFPASASRAGNEVTIFLWPFTDNQPGHEGVPNLNLVEPGVKFVGQYEFDQNGVRIAGGSSDAFFWQAKVKPKPSVIRFTLDEIRSGPPYRLSAHTHSVWTWRSAPNPSATVPRAWLCGSSLVDDFTRRCSAQDLLRLEYKVAAMRPDGSVPAGRQALTVTVTHFQPYTAAAKVTQVRVLVSFDNGRTWREAAISGRGRGRFLARYTTPRTARSAELRVTAADTAGSTVTETLPLAYRIAPRRAVPSALRPACPVARPRVARCFVLYEPHLPVNLAAGPGVAPAGWGAKALEAAYKLPVDRRTHQTVAVSIAFDTPRLERYLAIYRKQFGLPPCTTANGCFRKVNQRGFSTRMPPSGVGTGWDLEATLDVSMISAACPTCHILVVEASDASLANLAVSENTAARLGAQVISNSYGSSESGFSQALAADYDHPGHTVVVSSGDLGFTSAQFPANLRTVTAVGGTELSRAHNARGWREQVWITPFSGASGSGCSAYVAKPAWQRGVLGGRPPRAAQRGVLGGRPPRAAQRGVLGGRPPRAAQRGVLGGRPPRAAQRGVLGGRPPRAAQRGALACGMRTSADVSAVADHVAVYNADYGGWQVVAGTSASAPLIAGIYGLAGNATSISAGYAYRHAHSLFDVAVGNNDVINGTGGASCDFDYLCVARTGYDAPTGLGTPDGIGAF